ncbi:hypothetical protein E0500_042530 [Streptomyces sp. KM273126]|uniref:hypothetical protein n=1 Tax=Streptomyces sp. KM273126 TaxID=2545247 RepID=UPI00103900DB|nr:hypothetical protein [Streptomyces sp. KM273126]MBA2813812.1 hypothetical protein [Streptomyces sp. KM273126]
MNPWQWAAVVLAGLGLFFVVVFLVVVPIPALVESVRHMVRRRRGPRVLPSADAEGCPLAGRTREALPGRLVVDAGLSPRTVMKATGLKGVKAVPRAEPPPADALRRLRDGGTLTEPELDWLARGDRFPLAAMPPAKLPAAVTRVIERITAEVERERKRRDEAVGFLTWPETTGAAP